MITADELNKIAKDWKALTPAEKLVERALRKMKSLAKCGATSYCMECLLSDKEVQEVEKALTRQGFSVRRMGICFVDRVILDICW